MGRPADSVIIKTPCEKNMKENWVPIVVRIQCTVIKGRSILSIKNGLCWQPAGSLVHRDVFWIYHHIELTLIDTEYKRDDNCKSLGHTCRPDVLSILQALAVLQMEIGRLKHNWTSSRINLPYRGNYYVRASCLLSTGGEMHVLCPRCGFFASHCKYIHSGKKSIL